MRVPPARHTRGPIAVEVRETAAAVAEAHGVEVVRAPDPNHPEAIAALERIGPDLLLLACLPHVVRRATRETARLGALEPPPVGASPLPGPGPGVLAVARGGDPCRGHRPCRDRRRRCRPGRGAAMAGGPRGDRLRSTDRGPGAARRPGAGGDAPGHRAPDSRCRPPGRIRRDPPAPCTPGGFPARHDVDSRARVPLHRGDPRAGEPRSRSAARNAKSSWSGRSDSLPRPETGPRSRTPAASSRSASPKAC